MHDDRLDLDVHKFNRHVLDVTGCVIVHVRLDDLDTEHGD